MAPAASEIISAFTQEDGYQPFNYADLMLAVSVVKTAGLIDFEGPTKKIIVDPSCQKENRASYARDSRDYSAEEIGYILAAIANRGRLPNCRTKKLIDFAGKYASGEYDGVVEELTRGE